MPKGIPGDYTRYHLRRDREDEPRERAIATPTETGGTYFCPRCDTRLWKLWAELSCRVCGYAYGIPNKATPTPAAAFAEAERAYREAKDAIYGDLAEAAG